MCGPGSGAGVSGRPGGVRVTLLTRAGCHLCDDARIAVARVAGDAGTGWQEVDVDARADLVEAYGDRVPVILVDGREHGYWRVEEPRLRRALAGGRWGRPFSE
ncbi:glutaredoxin family protein [Frankia sp. Cr2]|uniref:glutaredoxin family protein n=1 Tax=Frankia sp. Cr2 TaxID=3073932 RepID=UPI003A103728